MRLIQAARAGAFGFHPEKCALCDPDLVTGEFTEHGGITRVPEYAEVIVEHQDEMVAWVEAGRPME